jgi:hypothetical protein
MFPGLLRSQMLNAELPPIEVVLKDARSQEMLRILLAALDGMYEEAINARIGSDEWLTYKIVINNSVEILEHRFKSKPQLHKPEPKIKLTGDASITIIP